MPMLAAPSIRAFHRLLGGSPDIATDFGRRRDEVLYGRAGRIEHLTPDFFRSLQHADDSALGGLAQIPTTCVVPWITPLDTSATASVSAFPTDPVPFSAVASEPLTVSVTALTISPVPLMVPMMVFFTLSTSFSMGDSPSWRGLCVA
jgi:hypothetical protein